MKSINKRKKNLHGKCVWLWAAAVTELKRQDKGDDVTIHSELKGVAQADVETLTLVPVKDP